MQNCKTIHLVDVEIFHRISTKPPILLADINEQYSKWPHPTLFTSIRGPFPPESDGWSSLKVFILFFVFESPVTSVFAQKNDGIWTTVVDGLYPKLNTIKTSYGDQTSWQSIRKLSRYFTQKHNVTLMVALNKKQRDSSSWDHLYLGRMSWQSRYPILDGLPNVKREQSHKWGASWGAVRRYILSVSKVLMLKNFLQKKKKKEENEWSELKPHHTKTNLTVAAVSLSFLRNLFKAFCLLTGAQVRAGWGCSPGAQMPIWVRYLHCPWAVPTWQARCENNIFPPSSPQLDRSINLKRSLVLAAAVTDVSYFITVSQGGFDGWRAKLMWLNEVLNH